MQTPTMPWHTRGLHFSDRKLDPLVSHLFMGLERRRASDSDVFQLEMTRMGMESHYRQADDITSFQISSSWDRFTCERTGEALIRALLDDIRLVTLLKPDLDAEVELEFLDDLTNSLGT